MSDPNVPPRIQELFSLTDLSVVTSNPFEVRSPSHIAL